MVRAGRGQVRPRTSYVEGSSDEENGADEKAAAAAVAAKTPLKKRVAARKPVVRYVLNGGVGTILKDWIPTRPAENQCPNWP